MLGRVEGARADAERTDGAIEHYRGHVQTAVAASATPYGYTLTIWTAGAVMAHERGLPNALDAGLLLTGAALGFGVVAGLAHGAPTASFATARRRPVQLWAGLPVLAGFVTISATALASTLIQPRVAWLVVGVLATTIYLLVTAGQYALADRSPRG